MGYYLIKLLSSIKYEKSRDPYHVLCSLVISLSKTNSLCRDKLSAPVHIACLDEFGLTLYVFTKGDAKLYVFKYSDQNMPSVLTKKKEIDLSD